MRSFMALLLAAVLAPAWLVSVPASAQEARPYSQAELDQMLAPIALYPDTVLSHVLIAATYPLEVVQAARWSRNHAGLSGQDAVDRVESEDWDPSVKALVAFPELLQRMDQDIAWTQSLGDAFLAQEGEVTDSIQYLRNQAYNNGQLQSNQQVNVVRETRYVYIEPAQPQVVYVPYYDPRVVYGHWRWAAYPPVYWHHPPGFSVSLGFYWGLGFHIRSSFFFSSFYWPSRHVVVVDHHYHNRYPNYGYRKGHGHYRPGYSMAHYDGAHRWKHDQHHRRGVSYHSDVSRERFSHREDGRSHDYAASGQAPQTRSMQRDWADRQRTRFVDNAGNRSASPLRNERPDRAANGSRPSDPGRAENRGIDLRSAYARRNSRGAPSRAPSPDRSDYREMTRNTARNNDRSKQTGSNRSVLPADSQPLVKLGETDNNRGRRGTGEAGPAAQRAPSSGSAAPESRAVRTGRDSNPQRSSEYLAAAPQRQATPGRQAHAQRPVQPQRQIQPQNRSPAERAPAPERAAKNQRYESRGGSPRERSGQDRGSRGRDRD